MLTIKDLNDMVKFIINTKYTCDNIPMQDVEQLQANIEAELHMRSASSFLEALKEAYYGEQTHVTPFKIYWGAHAVELDCVGSVYIGMMKMLEEYLEYLTFQPPHVN